VCQRDLAVEDENNVHAMTHEAPLFGKRRALAVPIAAVADPRVELVVSVLHLAGYVAIVVPVGHAHQPPA
jgi:hypothetical protein